MTRIYDETWPMINHEKIKPAFAALQEIFIVARWHLGKDINTENIYDLMDGAEYLAGLACRDDDQTDTFERYLVDLCDKHSCPQALRTFRETKDDDTL